MAHETVTIGSKRYVVTHDTVAIVLAIQELTTTIRELYGKREKELDFGCNKTPRIIEKSSSCEKGGENSRSKTRKSRAL
jgi:hypothetical protein